MTFGPPLVAARQIAGVSLSHGVETRHAVAALIASLTTIALLVYINIVQPYLLLQVLRVDAAAIGKISGQLAAVHEIVSILVMSLIGAWSDRIGRRRVYAAGFFAMAVGYFLYPLASGLVQLALFRMVFAAGAATALVMFTAIAVDYSQPHSRGKAIGLLNVVSGIGVLIMTAVLARMPQWLTHSGFEPAAAGRTTFWLTAALCLSVALVLAIGLKAGRAAAHRDGHGLIGSACAAVAAARRNRVLALSYGAALVGRSDLAIVGLFLPLWVTREGMQAGWTAGQIVVRSSILLAVHQLAVIASAYVVGWLNDRLAKLDVLIGGFFLAATGYGVLAWGADPLSNWVFLGIVPLAIGEISIVVTNNAMAGEQAAEIERGSVLGFIGVFGGIGVSLIAATGGAVFDSWGTSSLFAILVALNAIIISWALAVRHFSGPPTT